MVLIEWAKLRAMAEDNRNCLPLALKQNRLSTDFVGFSSQNPITCSVLPRSIRRTLSSLSLLLLCLRMYASTHYILKLSLKCSCPCTRAIAFPILILCLDRGNTLAERRIQACAGFGRNPHRRIIRSSDSSFCNPLGS